MKTFDDLSPEQQLENVRRWKEYYKTDRDEANAEIEQLEAINEDMFAKLRTIREFVMLQDADVFGHDMEHGYFYRDEMVESIDKVLDKARGEL